MWRVGEQTAQMDFRSATIPVGLNPHAVGVNPLTNKIYVANSFNGPGGNSVTVINGDNSTTPVAVGNSPFAIAVNTVTNKIYVANCGGPCSVSGGSGGASVTVINGADNTTATVPTGNGAFAIAVNSVTNKIYVANSSSNNVTVINGVDNTTTTVAAGTTPVAIAVNPATNKIYVANQQSPNLTVINGEDNTTATVATGNGSFAVAVNSVTNKIYVTNGNPSNNVTVINGVDNTTVNVFAGNNPRSIAVNPLTNKIYVANALSAAITVINGANNTTANVPVGQGPRAIVANPITNKIYVANEGSTDVTVIDGTNNSTSPVPAGSGPTALAYNPITSRVYVANDVSANVTVIDGTPATPPNLIDLPAYLVHQQYLDFLNRLPDEPGFAFWHNQIVSCNNNAGCVEVTRINVSASFFLSIEFQQTGYLVERTYKAAYADVPGTSTFGASHQLQVPVVRFSEFLQDTQRIGRGVVVLQTGWEQLLENNKQAYALEFVQTTRFTNAFLTSMTPAQFVDKLNQNSGNVLSASERTTAINLFAGAADSSNVTARVQVLRQVAEDVDFVNAEFNRAFVLMQYFGYLRRNANDAPDSDYTGYDFWLTKLNQFNGNYINAEMVKAFLSSIEYRQRFGP
jgi:YVTN family beta-propeller protein